MAASTVPGFLESSIVSPGTAAMMLALTQTIYDEDLAKKLVAKKGLKAVVTEVGGKTIFDDFNDRINRAVIGACLNSGLIEKRAMIFMQSFMLQKRLKRVVSECQYKCKSGVENCCIKKRALDSSCPVWEICTALYD